MQGEPNFWPKPDLNLNATMQAPPPPSLGLGWCVCYLVLSFTVPQILVQKVGLSLCLSVYSVQDGPKFWLSLVCLSRLHCAEAEMSELWATWSFL